MDRQSIREQFRFDFDERKKDGGTLEAAESITCALMCVAYAVGDLAEAVFAAVEAYKERNP